MDKLADKSKPFYIKEIFPYSEDLIQVKKKKKH
jgi:hypothetical protein